MIRKKLNKKQKLSFKNKLNKYFMMALFNDKFFAIECETSSVGKFVIEIQVKWLTDFDDFFSHFEYF